MAPSARRAPRSDARENRAGILAAARLAFAANPDSSLQSIARAAGVGQGTMYRHFPSREALLLAAYREEVEALAATAAHLLARYDPPEALRRWLEDLAAPARAGHPTALAVEAATTARPGSPLTAALDALLVAGRETGQIRRDAEAGEVLLLASCLWRTPDGPHCPDGTRRLLRVIIDGLLAGADGDGERTPRRPLAPQPPF